MFKHVDYITEGVCAEKISFDLIDGYVHHVKFVGGCRGNTTGVAVLSEGLAAEELIARLKGINCHDGNSCPNQLAIAVEQAMKDCAEA